MPVHPIQMYKSCKIAFVGWKSVHLDVCYSQWHIYAYSIREIEVLSGVAGSYRGFCLSNSVNAWRTTSKKVACFLSRRRELTSTRGTTVKPCRTWQHDRKSLL